MSKRVNGPLEMLTELLKSFEDDKLIWLNYILTRGLQRGWEVKSNVCIIAADCSDFSRQRLINLVW